MKPDSIQRGNCPALCYAALACCVIASAEEASEPDLSPSISAHRLSFAPVVDGDVLGDAAWSGASPATGFTQVRPREGTAASQTTEVFVGFTDSALYIGVVAYDEDPAAIVVTDSRRDSDLDDTDAFLVLIDGHLDRQNGFIFGTNAAGIEYDGQVSLGSSGSPFGGNALNLNWDGSWTVRSRIGDYGWSAEFEIPFRTLRFGGDAVQDWGINFQRNIRRNNEVAFWVPLARNRGLTRVSEAGTLRGVEPPTQRNLKLTPYVLGTMRRGGELSGSESDGDFGLDLKYSVTPSLTLDMTYNTDFAQVEVDEQQVNLDRFNLFFPEKRPFFLENAGTFSVGVQGQAQLFFSRRIGIDEDGNVVPVDGGVRLSGKIGSRTSIGLLHMTTDEVAGSPLGNRFSVARLNRELPNRSSVGAIFTHRGGGERDNSVYAVDGRWGIGDRITLGAWAGRSDTPGLEGRDDAFSVDGNYSSAAWRGSLRYTEVGEDFNPEIGFLSRTGYRNVRAFIMHVIRPDDLWGLLELRPHASYTGFWKFDDFHETGFLHVDNHWVFRTGMELHTGVNFTKSGVLERFEIVDDVWIEAGTYDHSEAQLVFFTDASQPFSFELRTNIGGRFGGDRMSIEPEINYRIGETFRTSLSLDYNAFDLPVGNGDFSVALARLRLSYSFTPRTQLQALVQYNDRDDTLGTNVRFSWLRDGNSGLFLVYNELNERDPGAPPTGREFILKYSHPFDVFD